jgi:hypothetical protein
MIDYTTGINIGSDIITDKIRVSTAKFNRNEYYGGGIGLIETWIFSDDKRQPNRQIFHKSERQAEKVHAYIVNNLRSKYCA